MARLQILQLPEGAGDDRPPYMLVIDQAAADVAASFNAPDGCLREGLAEEIRARSILVFTETVTIPANEALPLPLLSAETDDEPDSADDVDYTEMIETVDRVLGINSGRGKPDVAGWLLTACRELEKSEAARAHLRRERDALKTAATQPTEPVSIDVKMSPLSKRDVADAVRQEIDRAVRWGQRGMR